MRSKAGWISAAAVNLNFCLARMAAAKLPPKLVPYKKTLSYCLLVSKTYAIISSKSAGSPGLNVFAVVSAELMPL